jgi:tRNA(Ile)-lysidine synthetase-like protein
MNTQASLAAGQEHAIQKLVSPAYNKKKVTPWRRRRIPIISREHDVDIL